RFSPPNSRRRGEVAGAGETSTQYGVVRHRPGAPATGQLSRRWRPWPVSELLLDRSSDAVERVDPADQLLEGLLAVVVEVLMALLRQLAVERRVAVLTQLVLARLDRFLDRVLFTNDQEERQRLGRHALLRIGRQHGAGRGHAPHQVAGREAEIERHLPA